MPRKIYCCVLLLAMCAGRALSGTAPEVSTPSLDRGFRFMYNLDFSGAQEQFSLWEQVNPADPLGPVAEAAGLLFSELNRLGILEAQFFENDSNFRTSSRLTPDPAVRKQFDAALERAIGRAQKRRQSNPKDPDALFALTLSAGLNADYAALVEKRNMASLRYTREATSWAEQLLATDPSYYDAYLATGLHKYIIGSMAAPVRWVLRLGGLRGDKQAGIYDLEQTAAHGRYLAPFARILLAIAYLRQHDRARARGLLEHLREEFPENHLFAREIARLDAVPGP